MFEGLKDFIDLGGTVVVTGMFIYCITQIVKSKKNGLEGNGKSIFNELEKMNNNHLSHIQSKIEEGNRDLISTIHNDNSKIIELLGEIKGRISK